MQYGATFYSATQCSATQFSEHSAVSLSLVSPSLVLCRIVSQYGANQCKYIQYYATLCRDTW